MFFPADAAGDAAGPALTGGTAEEAIERVLNATARVMNEERNTIRSTVLVKEMFSPTNDAVLTVKRPDGSRGYFSGTEGPCSRIRTKTREEMLALLPASPGASLIIRRGNGTCESFIEGRRTLKGRGAILTHSC